MVLGEYGTGGIRRAALAYAVYVCAIAATLPAVPGAQTDATRLTPGFAIERELNRDKADIYQVTLAAGDFLAVLVTKRGIDVALSLSCQDGRQVAAAHTTPSLVSDESLVAIAESGGTYTLKVQPALSTPKPGRYVLHVVDMRRAETTDRVRVEAEAAFQRGRALEGAAQPRGCVQGLTEYETALARFRQIGDRRGETRALTGTAACQDYLGRHESLETAKEAARLAQETGDELDRAIAIHVAGTVYEHRGDLTTALENYEEARAICEKASDLKAQALVLNSEGIIHGRLGESEEAIVCFERSLALSRETGYKQMELLALSNIGVAYKNLGELDKALDAYEQNLAELRVRKDTAHQAVTLNNMGNIERLRGRNEKALELHLEALTLSRESGDPETEARSLNTIGATYFALGDYGKALDYHRQALVIRKKIQDLPGQGTSLRDEGRALLRLGEVDQALVALRESLSINRRVSERSAEVLTLRNLAEAERDGGNISEALNNIRAAVDLDETLRRRVTSPTLRTSFAAFEHDKYELLIDLLEARHRSDANATDDAEAFQVAERVRARVLLESLLDGRVDLRQGVDAGLLDREGMLQKQLDEASRQLTRLLGAKTSENERTEAASQRVETLSQDYEKLEAEIRRRSPSYAAVTQPEPLTAADVEQKVLDDQTVLLEFALGDKRSWLWAVTASGCVSVELLPRSEIELEARRVYELFTARQKQDGESVAARGARVVKADRDARKESAALSRMLFGGVAAQLNGKWRHKRLAIVPDGALEYLPFAALPMPEARLAAVSSGRSEAGQRSTLVEQHEIVVLPSATVLAALRREAAARLPAPHAIAVIADPVFEHGDPRVGWQTPPADGGERGAERSSIDPIARLRGSTVARLPFSREEADAIAALAPSGDVFEATDFEANRATALEGSLSRYRMVHFATHGVVDSARPELSGLILSLVDRRGSPQNGYLRLHDIYNMPLNADLVVLSACQTALGKEIKGEGLVGLTRAFMYAGTPRVVASLWEVSDLATAELMKRFYRGMLQQHLRPAAALRAAQLAMSQDSRWSAPYYWAGFLLEGDWK